jgi:CDP-diacylglycerol---glycerol-3-phosphate 3-phosphatidyltransferase
MTKNVIGQTVGGLGSQWRDALARRIIRYNISPTALTLIGVLINLLGGFLIGIGAFAHGAINWIHIGAGLVILVANIFDMLDGAVARMSKRVTKFGAFADSVLDRYSDMALFAGAITFFALKHDSVFVVVAAIAAIGSLMTSYTRARAEALLPGNYNSGYMERPERIVILAFTCILNRLYVGMIFIAILGNIATFHRIWDAHQTAFNLEHPDRAGKGYGSPTAPAIVRFGQRLLFWNFPRQTWQHDLMGLIIGILTVLAPAYPPF